MSKKIMKKILIGTLLAFGLTACGGGGEKKEAAKLDPNQKVTLPPIVNSKHQKNMIRH